MKDEQKASVEYTPPLRQAGREPRLSWERDPALQTLETAAYPLYIHEKVHPNIFVNELRKFAQEDQNALWEQFNGLPEDAAYEWYKHQGNWQNRIIRGDSARVMASLLAKEGMPGHVQMVYCDPPYGISFRSNFQVSTRSRNVGAGEDSLPNDQATVSTFRDTYRNGIHSYLDGIFRNAYLARDLLCETGSFILQMGSANVHRIAILLDEVFGSENRIALVPFPKSGSAASSKLPNVTDYLLWYAKDRPKCKYNQLYEELSRQEKLKHTGWLTSLELPDGSVRSLTDEEKQDVSRIPEGSRFYGCMPLTSQGASATGRSDPFLLNGIKYKCPPNTHWSVSMDGLAKLAELGRLHASPEAGSLRWKIYENEIPGRRISNLWHRTMSANDLHYVVETDEEVIERCILMATDPGDLVLDITCGSGTTAFVAEKWGRRWITTDTSGVAVALARQRLATGFFKYYLLKDSEEGASMEGSLAAVNTSSVASTQKTAAKYLQDLSKGFVYKRVPYVSAATLAYAEEKPQTLLVNQPYEKKGTLRVSSPFTVESESPYRYITPYAAQSPATDLASDRTAAIVSALELAGITAPNKTVERMRFGEITQWSDKSAPLITHVATVYASNDETGAPQGKAAIAIAPDDMTVSSAYINSAAAAAVNMPGKFDTLVVIAFEFEAAIRSSLFESRGRLKLIKAQANRDLQIGNLKDGSSDHAFVMIGEPDVSVAAEEDGRLTAEVLGFDTYNPATGNITQSRKGGGQRYRLLDARHQLQRRVLFRPTHPFPQQVHGQADDPAKAGHRCKTRQSSLGRHAVVQVPALRSPKFGTDRSADRNQHAHRDDYCHRLHGHQVTLCGREPPAYTSLERLHGRRVHLLSKSKGMRSSNVAAKTGSAVTWQYSSEVLPYPNCYKKKEWGNAFFGSIVAMETASSSAQR